MIYSAQVLDHGSIELDAEMATDLSVINAARVSLNKKSEFVDQGGEKLINFLMKKKHGTPFEHNSFRFRVKAPIFVFREWHRHRIGHSYNEWSARYSMMEPVFYIPTHVVQQTGKAGDYTFSPAPEDLAGLFRSELRFHCEESYKRYEDAVANGISKQQARFMLPVNVYSQMIWTCNARSLMNFLVLRNHDAAQWEIRQYAIAAEEMFAAIMPITYRCFIENGRVAP
ncbi:MAG: FAD-dependent thymidylate synthase [Pyrinomonadaceae bacterium]